MELLWGHIVWKKDRREQHLSSSSVANARANIQGAYVAHYWRWRRPWFSMRLSFMSAAAADAGGNDDDGGANMAPIAMASSKSATSSPRRRAEAGAPLRPQQRPTTRTDPDLLPSIADVSSVAGTTEVDGSWFGSFEMVMMQ
jgi:hypothetical protein